NPVPAVALLGAVTANLLVAAADTVMVLLLPVTVVVTVSVAVMVWLPAVFSVAGKGPLPVASLPPLSLNLVRLGSLPVKLRLPCSCFSLFYLFCAACPVGGLLLFPSAPLFRSTPAPAVALLGAVTANLLVAAAVTVMVLLLPVIVVVTVSVAVMVWLPAVLR